jgi:hypothetical protein
MAEADELQRQLLASQNPDGGWPFCSGTSSWTEPTGLALLALESDPAAEGARRRGIAWLGSRQKANGSWAPNDRVAAGTWVTSLVCLTLARIPNQADRFDRAADWVAGQVYPEPAGFERFLLRILGSSPSKMPGSSAWFPGTAGWVSPTALSILALSQAAVRSGSTRYSSLANNGRIYLLSRRARDGGWNHGGSSFRSEDALSYPETTGLALLALSHSSAPELVTAWRLGETFLKQPDSLEGLSWLELGMLAHRRQIQERPPLSFEPRTNRDRALRLLALAAEAGDHRFLPS